MATQAAGGNGASTLSQDSADAPVALRVIDEALHVEAERSYLAVCALPAHVRCSLQLTAHLHPANPTALTERQIAQSHLLSRCTKRAVIL